MGVDHAAGPIAGGNREITIQVQSRPIAFLLQIWVRAATWATMKHKW